MSSKRTVFKVALTLGCLLGMAAYWWIRPSMPLPLASSQASIPMGRAVEPEPPANGGVDVDLESSLDAVRTSATLVKRSFLVVERATGRPVSGAAVCAASPGGRRALAEVIGHTDGQGRLLCEAVLPEGCRFSVVARGYSKVFEKAGATEPGLEHHVAYLDPTEILRVEVVDEIGRTVEGASLVVSRKPLDAARQIDWSLRRDDSRVWASGCDLDAEMVVWTGQDGVAEIAVAGPGSYFWVVSKHGYVPWGNAIGEVIKAPGNYRIVLHGIVGAAIRVEGDVVVSEAHPTGFKMHMDSLRHLMAVRRHLKEELGANVVLVAPRTAETEHAELHAAMFLRFSGDLHLSVPMREITPDFAAFVHRVATPLPSGRASGSVRLDLLDGAGRNAVGLQWTMSSTTRRGSKVGSGSAEVELPPGDYRLKLRSDAASEAIGPIFFRLNADEVLPLVCRLPENLVGIEVVFEKDGRTIATDGLRQVSFEREGVRSEWLEVGGGDPCVAWLPAGRYSVRGWTPGFAVGDVDVDVAAGETRSVVRLPARDR